MHSRARALLPAGLLLLVAAEGGAAGPKPPASSGRCLRAVVEGEVRAGEAFRRSFGGGLDVLLESVASGWVVRVIPSSGLRPREDYAEIATPPYRSLSPLLLSTDYGFRAQDAVGWNPRRFRYAADGRAFAALEGVYGRVMATASPSAADEAALAKLVALQPNGELEILDASLAPGTGDQTRAAELVATHFGSSAHRTEAPPGGKATALGHLGFLGFRLKLDLKPGSKPAPGLKVETFPCQQN